MRLRTRRTAIVGPNGCGKSNIIDAVRWTMGESRAGALRGENLQDVIFNGAQGRSPAEWCGVELRLEDTKDAPGAWGRFSEITIKRELRRSGESIYSINGQAVRRRDVADFFRGTGVGARAYAVVEQGAISRVVESSPQQMRSFLEEAAGISHYKERKRDAERRLQNARDNLARAADSLGEARRRAEALARQSGAAEKHRELSARIDEARALALFLRRTDADAEAKGAEQNAAAVRDKADAARERAAAIAAEITQAREAQEQSAAAAAQAQRDVFAAEAKVGEWAQKIAHLQDVRQRASAHIQQAEAQRTGIAAELQETRSARERAAREIAAAAEAARDEAAADEAARDEAAAAGAQCAEAETVFESAREALADARRAALTAAERAEVLKAQQTELAAQIAKQQSAQDDGDGETAAAQTAADKAKAAAAELDKCAAARKVADDERARAQSEVDAAAAAVRAVEEELVAVRAEGDAVAKVSGADEAQFATWAGSPAPRLAEAMGAQAGEWARALDSALGRDAPAFVVAELDKKIPAGTPPPGVALIENPIAEGGDGDETPHPDSLLAKIHAPQKWRRFLSSRLAKVRAAESDAAAVRMRKNLAPFSAVVTKSGNYYTAESVHFYGDIVGGHEWQRRLRDLEMRAQARQKKLSAARGELADLSALFQKAQSRQAAAAAGREAALENLRACEVAAAAAAQKRDWTARRNAEIADAIAALQAQDKRLQDALAEAAQAAAAAQVAARQNEDALAQARLGRDEAQARLAAAADAAGKLAQQKAGREIAGRNLRERLAELAARVKSLEERRERAQVGEDKLRAELEELSDEAARQNRAQAQAARDEARQKSENAQAAAKESSDALGALEAQRDAALSDAETLRERAGELRLVAREQQIKRRGFADSMEEIGADENALAALANADPPPRAGDLEAEAERLRRSRDKLGAINFAAAEELREAAEKRDFLQAQVKDIEEAAATLTQSIRRIDAEGGARLRDVKVRLDEKLNEMFRAMFAGGEARLAKSGDDEKGEEGGFAIFAQPPGKKVRAIAALSGGEKTLTALAFLFALFSLNPAPFCLLDEADAQLDEANTRRYAALLEKMSAATQFLFITHNKVMLESAQALIGVTQAERGVSRLVSVSVAEALNTIEKNAA